MRFALTADLHLTTMKDHPERYHALQYILDQTVTNGIDTLDHRMTGS